MADPDEIQRAVAKMQRAIEPAARLQEQTGFADLAEQIRQTWSPAVAAEFAKVSRIQSDAVSAALRVEQQDQFRRIAEQAARAFSRSDIAKISDQIGRTYSPAFIRAVSRQAVDSIRVADFAMASPADVDVGEAVTRFEAELTAEDDGSRPSLAARLAALTPVRQVSILLAGLIVLDQVQRLLAELSGEDIPDALQQTTQLCFAVVSFLLIVMQEQRDDD